MRHKIPEMEEIVFDIIVKGGIIFFAIVGIVETARWLVGRFS